MTGPLQAAATRLKAAIRARKHGNGFGFRQELQHAVAQLHRAGCAATAELVADLSASAQPRSELYYDLRQLTTLLESWAHQEVRG